MSLIASPTCWVGFAGGDRPLILCFSINVVNAHAGCDDEDAAPAASLDFRLTLTTCAAGTSCDVGDAMPTSSMDLFDGRRTGVVSVCSDRACKARAIAPGFWWW